MFVFIDPSSLEKNLEFQMLWIVILWTTTLQKLKKFLFRIVPNLTRVWWISKENRNWFYGENGTILDDIFKTNADADVSIYRCPGKQFGYVDLIMDLILTIVFYNEQNDSCKVFCFNSCNQILPVF